MIKDFGRALAWGSGLSISTIIIIFTITGTALTIGICCSCFIIQLIIDGAKQSGQF